MNKKLAKLSFTVLAIFLLNLPITQAAVRVSTSNNTATQYENAKKEWQTIRNTLRTRIRAQITNEERVRALEKARSMITNALDRTIAHLRRITVRIQNSQVITIERRTRLTTELQAQITALETLRARVQTATTRDELKTAVSEIKKKFIEIRSVIKKIVTEILTSHIDKVIEKLTTIASKLETEITTLKTQGQSVTDFEKTLTEAKTLLTKAKNQNDAGYWKEARRLAEQARTKLAKLAGQIKAAKAKIQGGESETE